VSGDGIAFTEPTEGGTVNTDNVTVYGSVSAMEIHTVEVNGVAGLALPDGHGFTATVPLVEGPNTITAVITGMNGETASGVLHVNRRLTEGSAPDDLKSQGGCSAVGGLEVLAALGLLGLSRRRL
jgi:hypothetical protein